MVTSSSKTTKPIIVQYGIYVNGALKHYYMTDLIGRGAASYTRTTMRAEEVLSLSTGDVVSLRARQSFSSGITGTATTGYVYANSTMPSLLRT
ncbi:hypothetical protein LCGC14_2786190, partial [marine sediment metagenome]